MVGGWFPWTWDALWGAGFHRDRNQLILHPWRQGLVLAPPPGPDLRVGGGGAVSGQEGVSLVVIKVASLQRLHMVLIDLECGAQAN